ncbi:MAG: GNAT family N-acetyltransferase [Planctomycetes bacterium]|nr:GNAT family N-acetyltransferase [Planctomycetota bacterium]
MDGIEIIPFQPSVVSGAARLHARCFPGYFLTHLGPTFLRRFYAEFCHYSYGLVARRVTDGKIVGLVAGWTSSRLHCRRFYRRNLPLLLPLVLYRFVIDPVIRRQVGTRMWHVKCALTSALPVMRRRKPQVVTGKEPDQLSRAGLLSIAVDPDYQGTGLAGELMREFEDLLRAAGHQAVRLSVFAENERAIAFYRKSGWELVRSSTSSWSFEKTL